MVRHWEGGENPPRTRRCIGQSFVPHMPLPANCRREGGGRRVGDLPALVLSQKTGPWVCGPWRMSPGPIRDVLANGTAGKSKPTVSSADVAVRIAHRRIAVCRFSLPFIPFANRTSNFSRPREFGAKGFVVNIISKLMGPCRTAFSLAPETGGEGGVRGESASCDHRRTAPHPNPLPPITGERSAVVGSALADAVWTVKLHRSIRVRQGGTPYGRQAKIMRCSIDRAPRGDVDFHLIVAR